MQKALSSMAKPAVSRFKLHHIYFLLAAFDLITISATLTLGHLIAGIHQSSVAENQQWITRIGRFGELSKLGAGVDGPPNDVFESRDPEGERIKMRAARQSFDMLLASLRAEAQLKVSGGDLSLLTADLDIIANTMQGMTSESEIVFDTFATVGKDKAGEHMAIVDRLYAQYNANFGTLNQTIQTIQTEYFAKQSSAVAGLQRFERVIALLVALMVGCVVVYGHKLSKTMSAAEGDRIRSIKVRE